MSEGVLFYAEQDVQQGAADPGVGKLSGFQKIAEGTPGSKIISLIDDPVGEVFNRSERKHSHRAVDTLAGAKNHPG